MATRANNKKTGKATPKVTIQRPSWKLVYDGYPKIGTNYNDVKDEDAIRIFEDIFTKAGYQKLNEERRKNNLSEIKDACATRVSLGLLNGSSQVSREFQVINNKNKFYLKGISTSASSLRIKLEELWGKANVVIQPYNGRTIDNVAEEIKKNGYKNGVYIIIGGFADGISGHATLWIGERKREDNKVGDVIGGKNYADYLGTIYFWELK